MTRFKASFITVFVIVTFGFAMTIQIYFNNANK